MTKGTNARSEQNLSWLLKRLRHMDRKIDFWR